MTDLKKLESLAFRLVDLPSLRKLAVEGLQFEYADKPVSMQNWTDDEKEIVVESKIIAEKNDFFIYYIQTKTDSLKHWKGIAGKIIKEKNGFCLVCSHNPSGFKWVFSSLSKEFSKSFSETRHVPIEIRPSAGVPSNFVEFLGKLKVGGDFTATSLALQVSEAFDTFAVEIHNELTVNVFEALKTLSAGIISDKNNKLSLSDETLEEIRPHIFTLLYRIIFILYAEDRGIFPVENATYHKKFSLKWIKEEWLLKKTNTNLAEYEVQKRLKNLFKLIELGSEAFDYPKEEFSMRSYYGRLFDREINSKLESWKISNPHLTKTLELLSRTKDKKGNYFFLDYAALETRHLGAVYENLLEKHLHVKNKKIVELLDTEERKASGSYYTPKYIVDYIVQNSIKPLIDKIINENPDKQIQIDKILELKILDPAMGSGHFLVGAIEYVAKRLCEIEFGEITEQSYIERKRDVVRRCIYGVDMNPLAVDLASLSLWLETLSSDKPLSFLNSHLRCGNSLIGSEIQSIFGEHDIHSKTTQTTLFESRGAKNAFKKNIKNFLMFENLKDDTPSAVKIKLEEYSKMQSKGTIYKDLQFLLNCKTAESFGVKLPVLFRDYSTKIGENSLDYYTNEDFQKIDILAKQEAFFHWELEFPQIFYDENGNVDLNDGFDVIIGNPPWSSKIGKADVKISANKFGWNQKNINICAVFIIEFLKKVKTRGVFGFLLPKVVIKNTTYFPVRQEIIQNYFLRSIGDFGQFPGVASDAVTWIIQKSKIQGKTEIMDFKETPPKKHSVDCKIFSENPSFIFSLSITPEIQKILSKINTNSKKLHPDYCLIKRGIEVGQQSNIVKCLKCGNYNEADFKYYSSLVKKCKTCKSNLNLDKKFSISSKDKTKRYVIKCISGNQLQRYKIQQNYFIPSTLEGISYKEEAFSDKKILVKRIAHKIEASFIEKKLFGFNTVYSLYNPNLKKSDFLIILGILNSSLIDFYYEFSYNVGMNLTTQVTIDFLKTLPIKFPQDEKIKQELVNLVEKIIIKYEQENNEKENDIITNTLQKINDLVFQIYNINNEERKIIQNELES